MLFSKLTPAEPDAPVAEERPASTQEHHHHLEDFVESPSPQRLLLPASLFLLTCMSTYSVGQSQFGGGWQYMLAVMGILVTHEAGHFFQALRHGIPATLPYFIPLPYFTGTMGAVIVQGSNANRRQLFDIGITGPLAGLVVAVPVVCLGVINADVAAPPPGAVVQHYGDPLLVELLIVWLRPELAPGTELVLNPLLMAGWFGLLLTGLNMLPLSQLDGGHVTYALFGKNAHLLARGLAIFAIGYMVATDQYQWFLMLILVLLIGLDHPPTTDDEVPLGFTRCAIGLASLLIPVLCFHPTPIAMVLT